MRRLLLAAALLPVFFLTGCVSDDRIVAWPFFYSGAPADGFSPPSSVFHVNHYSEVKNQNDEPGVPVYIMGPRRRRTEEHLLLKEREYFLLSGLLCYGRAGTMRVWKRDADQRRAGQLGWTLKHFFWSHPDEDRETVLAGNRKKVTGLMEELGFPGAVPETPEECFRLRREVVDRYCEETGYSEHRILYGLLWGAWRTDDESEYQITPLFRAKKSPGCNSWSFLWLLFHYENNSGKKSGSVFFIPWGER